MSTLAFYAQFITNKIGVNGLTVVWDVEQITRLDGTRTSLVTSGATTINIGRRGLYGYLLSNANTKLYDYIATAITATTTVDQQEVAALWTVYEVDVIKSDNIALNGRLAEISDIPTAINNATAAATAILVTPANKLATSADGSIDGLSANAQQDVADALSVTPMVLP